MLPRLDITRAVAALRRGGLIAYPTEGVWGLGCDPADATALTRLDALKGRAPGRGYILVLDSPARALPYLQALPEEAQRLALASWPGPHTFVVPGARAPEDVPGSGDTLALQVGSHPVGVPGAGAPEGVLGSGGTLALRVSSHPVVTALCAAFGGPLVSTSANPSGAPPALSPRQVEDYFAHGLDGLVEGELTTPGRVSDIRDLATGDYLRRRCRGMP